MIDKLEAAERAKLRLKALRERLVTLTAEKKVGVLCVACVCLRFSRALL